MGIPSIGFDIVGLRDAIDNDQSGILVPFGNTENFAKAMLILYQDNEKLERMKNNAIERVLNFFSADAVFHFQDDFYKKLISQKVKK
jgi:glycosyltransferase involved in cell wall biosynthesis